MRAFKSLNRATDKLEQKLAAHEKVIDHFLDSIRYRTIDCCCRICTGLSFHQIDLLVPQLILAAGVSNREELSEWVVEDLDRFLVVLGDLDVRPRSLIGDENAIAAFIRRCHRQYGPTLLLTDAFDRIFPE